MASFMHDLGNGPMFTPRSIYRALTHRGVQILCHENNTDTALKTLIATYGEERCFELIDYTNGIVKEVLVVIREFFKEDGALTDPQCVRARQVLLREYFELLGILAAMRKNRLALQRVMDQEDKGPVPEDEPQGQVVLSDI